MNNSQLNDICCIDSIYLIFSSLCCLGCLHARLGVDWDSPIVQFRAINIAHAHDRPVIPHLTSLPSLCSDISRQRKRMMQSQEKQKSRTVHWKKPRRMKTLTQPRNGTGCVRVDSVVWLCNSENKLLLTAFFFSFIHKFCIESYVPREPQRYLDNLWLCEHGIWYTHICEHGIWYTHICEHGIWYTHICEHGIWYLQLFCWNTHACQLFIFANSCNKRIESNIYRTLY